MPLARYQFTVTDDQGNVLPGASVEVRKELPGSPIVSLYSDREGAVPIGNPFQADSEAYAAFHVEGGAYRVTVTSGSFSRVWRYVAVGLAAERDYIDTFTPRGPWNPATTYAQGDLVDFGGFAFVSNDDGNVGHSPPGIGSPLDSASSDAFWTYLAVTGADGEPGESGSSDVTGTSATSIALGASTPTFTVVEEDRGWSVGARLRVARTAAPTTHFMEGIVTAYSGFSLTLAVDLVAGAGTFTDWTINLAGEPGTDGANGTNGAAATIQIGQVNTIPPGSPSAAVRNSGTENAAILDFDIPQGVPGTDGTDGAPGAPGAPGADGVDPGYLYNFETSTSAPPSAGAIRFNNANLAAATQAFISDTTRGGADITTRLLELFDAARDVLSTFILTDPVTEAQASFSVTSAADSGAYITIGLSGHAGATSFSAGAISLQREIAGANGEDGAGTGNVNAPTGSPGVVAGEVAIYADATGTQLDSSGLKITTARAAAIEVVIDGNGSVLTTGVKGSLEVPFDCELVGARAFADVLGSIAVDVLRSTFATFPPGDGSPADSIVGAAPVIITSAFKSQDETLVGWTKILNAGDVLTFVVNSVVNITRLTLSLRARKN